MKVRPNGATAPIKGILLIITLGFTGTCYTTPPETFTLPTSAATLTVEAVAGSSRVEPGDSFSARAIVSGGNPPYTFSWDAGGASCADSCFDFDNPTSAYTRVRIDPWCQGGGGYSVSVVVTDSNGRRRSDRSSTVFVPLAEECVGKSLGECDRLGYINILNCN